MGRVQTRLGGRSPDREHPGTQACLSVSLGLVGKSQKQDERPKGQSHHGQQTASGASGPTPPLRELSAGCRLPRSSLSAVVEQRKRGVIVCVVYVICLATSRLPPFYTGSTVHVSCSSASQLA